VEGTLTSYLGLTKPGLSQSADIRVINADLDIIDAAVARTLVTNPGLEVWQRGTGPFSAANAYAADRWQVNPQGASTLSVARDAGNADVGSLYCAALTYTHAVESSLVQKIEDYAQLRGRTVTFTARVKCATASAVRLSVYDTVNGTRYGAFGLGSGAYETLSVTAPIAAAATQVQVAVVLDASATAYVDNAVLALGAAAVPYAPLHPAEDLARCLRYYQEMGGLDPSEYILSLQCYSTTQANGPLRYVVEMAIAPTITVSAPGDWRLSSATFTTIPATGLIAANVTRRTCVVSATVASGLVAGNVTVLFANNTANARIRLEANP